MRYEKGRKEASRRRIKEVAAKRFRRDGIAASGLAGIMGDAGLTIGAFQPHFKSKADLVRESLAEALNEQSQWLADALADGGLDAVIASYLSTSHRDRPASGCVSAALAPELARQPVEIRRLYAKHLQGAIDQLAAALPPQTPDPQSAAFGFFATLVGALQLARATKGTEMSDRILAAGAEAARALVDQYNAPNDSARRADQSPSKQSRQTRQDD